jgi:16S rRNA (cytosine1402-N4)-methyltransferase
MNDSRPASVHIPVLSQEVLQYLAPQAGQLFVDGTLGGGGHTRLLAERVGPDGRVLALDRDPQAVAAAERELAGQPVMVAQASYCDIPEILDQLGIDRVHGILLDLGLSSDQLADGQRGFSYDAEGPLDLRFDPRQGEPAWRMLERLSADQLARILMEFGEERYSRRIARKMVERRREAPIRTAADLARLVRGCVPRAKHHRIDPATRTFQALRIAVNQELKLLGIALRRLPERLVCGGRLAIISFHSLEDRPVKWAMRDDPRLHVVTRKPVRAGGEELRRNPRSGSARLRVAERVEQLATGSTR